MAYLTNTDGYSELVIAENCGYDVFYSTADKLKTEFQANFVDKVDDFDTLYWVFLYKEGAFTLHYNIYFGVSIYPSKAKESTVIEIDLLAEIANRWSD